MRINLPQWWTKSFHTPTLGQRLHRATTLNERLVQVKTDGNAIAGISAVVQIISVVVVVDVHVIAVVPIV